MKFTLPPYLSELTVAKLSYQQRVTAIVVSSIVACCLLLLIFSHDTEKNTFSMEPGDVVISTHAPIEDTASRDTAEESLDAVAVEYNKLLDKVRDLSEKQRAYQEKTAKVIQSLRDEIKALKASLKAAQVQHDAAEAEQSNVIKLATSLPSNDNSLTAHKNASIKIQPSLRQAAYLPTAKEAAAHHIQSRATSPEDAPITFVNDISLPVNGQTATAPFHHRSQPPNKDRRAAFNKPVLKNTFANNKPQASWPNVNPDSTQETDHHRQQSINDMQQAFNHLSPTSPQATRQASLKKAPTPSDVIPYYTLPANATGLQAKLMTALVGRIPVKGHVQDPYPFKIILGQENLAANGLKVPQVSGMIVAGFAVGDMTLRSVKGWITSVTFVFPDGRIHTVQANAQGGSLPTQAGSLGYLSDPYGNPFLPGKLITNAPSEIATQIALGSAQGMAGALTHQSTQIHLPTSGHAALLTPSPQHFTRWLLGQSGQQAATRVNNWWQAHHTGSFDAIYVPAGKSVVINFTREIAIDYHKQGRKLSYEKIKTVSPTATVSTLSLLPDASGLD